ncbi:MAG: hypothetical protein ACR2G6_05075 [Gemmatimonadaceae bacterium]
MTRHAVMFALSVASAAALGACSDSSSPAAATLTGPLASRLSSCKAAPPDREIPLPIAPRSQRVDLEAPTFSKPTNISNPLFPISQLSQVILVGLQDGVPFRTETTLLPGTQGIDLGYGTVQTLTSQYVAYLDRRIEEVALDWYGQADDGSVSYFGEDVFNYEEGRIADTDGTWLACRDGPVAMIMPALPRVGNVYRPENVYPLVFEEVTVKAVGQTVAGPLGPVAGAILVEELHMDGTYEDKVFAPGYGEFSTGSGANVEALAVAIPTDALPGPTPAELRTLLAGARSVFQAARSGDWSAASRTVNAMNAAWVSYQAGSIPRLLKPLMAESLDDLTQAVSARKPTESRQAALDVSRNGLDILLLHRSRIEVDFARLDLWARQIVIDAEARNAAGIRSDVVIIRWILDRLANTGDARAREDVQRARRLHGEIKAAEERGDFGRVLEYALRLQETFRERVQ